MNATIDPLTQFLWDDYLRRLQAGLPHIEQFDALLVMGYTVVGTLPGDAGAMVERCCGSVDSSWMLVDERVVVEPPVVDEDRVLCDAHDSVQRLYLM